ncbi:MAG: DUF3332 domain-containing protein [Bacteroidaceae bacterium]|nr:DUF3332 domain-containing protein [Bacteroidaceae bacterium]
MKNFKVKMLAATVGTSILCSSCIGSFPVFNSVAAWNRGISKDKFVNELVFICLHIIPVYEVCYLADGLVFNSIEFWSNKSGAAVAKVGETKRMKGSNGDIFAITRTKKGYTIIDETRDAECKLIFDEKKKTWNAELDGKRYELMTMNDDGSITLNMHNGRTLTVNPDIYGVELAQQVAGAYTPSFDVAAR